jgi:UDP-glucose 4-epimerase
MRVVISGAHGFIGGTLGRLGAQRERYELVGIGRRRDAPAGWPGEYTQADLEWADLSSWLERSAPDVVIHAAGPASVSASFADPQLDFRESVLTWTNLLDAVRGSNVRPLIVFLSSAAVYGNPATLPVGEEAPIRPISPYGFHKAAAELIAKGYADSFGLDILTLRCFSLFGPSLRRLLVRELYEQLLAPGDTVWLEGTGAEERDYLSIEDLEEAITGLLDIRASFEGKGNLVLNVGRGTGTKVLALAHELRELVAPGKAVQTRGQARPGDPLRWAADTSRLRDLIPSCEPRPLTDSLADCVAAWDRERPLAQTT